MFKPYAIMVLRSIPTLYLNALWYSVKQRNYITSHTAFGAARMNLRMEFGSCWG
ncbi:MAG: hypothetical protein SGI92_27335 [Bryobacteraceae bacterium]|nr:hypothetical protein [Bryobacteraceae bacterium]